MSAHQALTQLVPLAAELDEDKVTPGVLGFIVFAVMALAVWALMKSMTRHMGRVDFKEPSTGEAAPSGKAASSGTAASEAPEAPQTPTPRRG